MGFLDKAKKLAEQAQTKLDEVQTQFNERQASGGPAGGSGPAVDYDKHGRPVTPADAPTPPHGDPLGEPHAPAPAPTGPTPDDSAPAPPHGDPLGESTPPKPPAAPPAGNGPSGMTSGDPLAG